MLLNASECKISKWKLAHCLWRSCVLFLVCLLVNVMQQMWRGTFDCSPRLTAHDAPGTIAAIAYAYVVSYLRLILPPTATDTKCEVSACTAYAAKQRIK